MRAFIVPGFIEYQVNLFPVLPFFSIDGKSQGFCCKISFRI